MQILLPRRHPAADVALGLVYIKNLPRLRRQLRIHQHQPRGQILMHSALAHPEFFRRLPYCRFRLDHVNRCFYSTLLDILLPDL